jgi:NitT/TauT family transport system substrate-binding protein
MRKVLLLVAATALVAGACASSEQRAQGEEGVLRLGMFPNLTHAPGYVALEQGIFEDALAPTTVDVTYFNSGSDAGTAVLSGSIDATYIGPGPATSLYLQSDGGVAIVSGVTAGGASFVVRKDAGIDSAEDLAGKRIAVPGLGNTQDVALRTWLHEHDLRARDEGGDVSVAAVDNPELVGLFRAGHLDGAWEPEPYPSLLIAEGLADPFVDEAELWPDGEFVTTVLLVNSTYMEANPGVVADLVTANVEAVQLIQDDPESAKAAAQAGLIKAGAPSLDQAVVDTAWDNLTFTWDPVAPSLVQGAANAYSLGYLDTEPSAMTELFRLDHLNDVLTGLDVPLIQVVAS